MRLTATLLLSVPLLVILVAGALNYQGVCLSGAQLSEEQRIQLVIDDFLKSQSFTEQIAAEIEANGERRLVAKFVPHVDDLILYENRADFLSLNPDCCEAVATGRKGFQPSFLHRITGHFSGFIRLRYIARVKTPDGDVRLLPREEFHATTNCGVVWDGI